MGEWVDRTQRLAGKALVIEIADIAVQFGEEFRSGHSHVPWDQLRGIRNRLAHEYHKTNYRIVWNTLVDSPPRLWAGLNRQPSV